MNLLDHPVDGLATPLDDPRWAAAQHAAASKVFERSPRLRNFLLDVTERALAGRTSEINEQQIGIRIFGKPYDYNPAENNTVRVQARILRKKLEDYYAGEGAAETLHVSIPKGGYVPHFEHAGESSHDAVAETATVLPLSQEQPRAAAKFSRIPVVALGAACLALALLSVWLWVAKYRAESMLTSGPGFGPLTSLVVGPGAKRTSIVVADSGLVVAQELANRDISLADYAGTGYRSSVESGGRSLPPAFWGYLLSRRYTSMADVVFYGRLLQAHPDSWKSVEVRHARDLQLRDFREHNYILLGSPRSNPWLMAFEDKLNFRFVASDPGAGAEILNQHPLPGEPNAFFTEMPGGSGKGYAYVAMTPNLTDSGRVLVIAGITMAATDLAVEFVCNPNASKTLASLWKLPDLKRVKSFELLFETSILAETVNGSKIVASRHGMRLPAER